MPDEPSSQGHADGRGGLLALLALQEAPLEMQILGRTLLHAALVGAAAGLVGAAFFVGLEWTQHLLLELLCGYEPLRAHGEKLLAPETHGTFRWWLLPLVPAIGALAGGALTRWAPETRGGGGDAMIEAFHHHDGVIRRRVVPIKFLASLFTLGAGGAGGREGPTMQIGGAIGSTVGRYMGATARERRALMVAGVAAGVSAVFRTPLGAALLAIEVLYRDDFESEALIPAVLASVVAYSISITLLGQSTLFGSLPKYPFVPEHLPLYVLLAVVVSLAAVAFLAGMATVRRVAAKLPGPVWARPAFGGLMLGVTTVIILVVVERYTHLPGQGLGILGSGYGAAQLAMSGASWFPTGSQAAELLLLLGIGKIVAASFTLGTGGSAGDFAPAMVIGGLIGGAFGSAATALLHDPRIAPAAFVLVGMGTFYGGVAHTPLASLVMVCEMAGSYDLLVPLMLAEGVAFILLRRRTLYHAQVVSSKASPARQAAAGADVLARTQVGQVLAPKRRFAVFTPATPMREVLEKIPENAEQDAFPVVDEGGVMRGLISADTLRHLATHREVEAWAVAADVMQPPVTIAPEADLRSAVLLMHRHGLRELPVLGADGKIVGLVDEQEISAAYLRATEGEGKRAPTARPF
jgi:CIC family chloride channel protein